MGLRYPQKRVQGRLGLLGFGGTCGSVLERVGERLSVASWGVSDMRIYGLSVEGDGVGGGLSGK